MVLVNVHLLDIMMIKIIKILYVRNVIINVWLVMGLMLIIVWLVKVQSKEIQEVFVYAEMDL